MLSMSLIKSHIFILTFLSRVWNACMPGKDELEELVWLLSRYSDPESPSPTMATGGGGGRPAPMPRGLKPSLAPKPHQQQGSHSQLGGRSMATLAADAAASVAQSHAHRGHGQMNEARAKTVLKEAVDAVVNSFAKHTHGYGRGKVSPPPTYIQSKPDVTRSQELSKLIRYMWPVHNEFTSHYLVISGMSLITK